MTKRRKRKILVAISDTHGWHKLGLLNPSVKLIEETEEGVEVPYTPALTPTQKWLWKCHRQDVKRVRELAGKDPIVLLHMGDIGHGDKYASRLVSHRKADQVLITVSNFEPWFKLPTLKAVRIAHGTAAHNFGFATVEILTAELLRGKHKDVSVKTLRHGLLTVDDVPVDWAHHGPYPGSRNWLKGNVARYYLRSLMMDEIMRGQTPPRLVLRGHYHELIWETMRIIVNGKTYTSDLLVLPAYCGLTPYAQQATRSISRWGCGLVAFEIVGGGLVGVHPFHRSVDLRTKEEL